MRAQESVAVAIFFCADPEDRTSVFGLTNGGTAGLIWGYLIVWAGYMLVFISIAEMTSM